MYFAESLLRKIIDSTTQSSNFVEEISSSSNEMVNGINEIAQSTSKTSTQITGILTDIQQISANSKENQKGANKTSSKAASLAKMAINFVLFSLFLVIESFIFSFEHIFLFCAYIDFKQVKEITKR